LWRLQYSQQWPSCKSFGKQSSAHLTTGTDCRLNEPFLGFADSE
jgi:hypothetical protein